MVPKVLADFKDLNGKDVPWLVSITQTLLGTKVFVISMLMSSY